jgi:hypothetical protein
MSELIRYVTVLSIAAAATAAIILLDPDLW